MRVIGALLLIAAASGFGMIRASELRKRPAVLHAMINAIMLLKSDISSRGMSLPDAAAHVAGQCAEMIRPMFLTVCVMLKRDSGTFFDAWNSGIDEISCLLPQEAESLRDLGAHLGKYDVSAQANALEACIDAMNEYEHGAAQDFKQFGRLYTGLGLTVGTMLAVALY